MAKSKREKLTVAETDVIDVEAPRPGLVELPDDDTQTEDTQTDLPRWRVSLVCPTPLAHASLEVGGENESEAKAAFCEANGISGSTHPWTIERL